MSDRRLQGQIKYRNPSHAKINFIQLIFLFLLILSTVTERGKESKRTECDTYRGIFYVYMHIVHIPLFPFLYIFKLNRDKKRILSESFVENYGRTEYLRACGN